MKTEKTKHSTPYKLGLKCGSQSATASQDVRWIEAFLLGWKDGKKKKRAQEEALIEMMRNDEELGLYDTN